MYNKYKTNSDTNSLTPIRVYVLIGFTIYIKLQHKTSRNDYILYTYYIYRNYEKKSFGKNVKISFAMINEVLKHKFKTVSHLGQTIGI